MKTVLLHVDKKSDAGTRLQCALDVTRQLGAHLTCLQATPLASLAAFSDYGGTALTMEMIQRLELMEGNVQDVFESRLKKEDVAWDFIRAKEDPAAAISKHGHLADLILMGRGSDFDLTTKVWVGDVIQHAEAPVMIVPETLEAVDLSGPAMVAWNGSAQSARAVRQTLPLLRRAKSVHLVSVQETDERTLPHLNASEYLSKHGVPSEIDTIPAGPEGVAGTLLQKAQQLNAGLLISGAYGHSRLREWLLGGVTRRLLKAAPLPLVLVH